MSEEVKVTEDKPVVKKGWFNRAWSAVAGLIVGIAAMFGVNQAQLSTVKADATKAYADVQAVIAAIQEKKYIEAIEAGKNAMESLKTITGEVKEITEVVKDSAEEYKGAVLEIKTAADAKDYKKVLELSTALAAKITEKVPADQLTGTTKKVYDIVAQVINDSKDGKYEPVIDLVNKLVDLFKKDAAPTPAPTPEPAPAAN